MTYHGDREREARKARKAGDTSEQVAALEEHHGAMGLHYMDAADAYRRGTKAGGEKHEKTATERASKFWGGGPAGNRQEEATVGNRTTNAQGRDPAGRFGDDAEDEAAERGESPEELAQDDREGPDGTESIGSEAEEADGNVADERGGDAGGGGKKPPTRNTPSTRVRNAREKSCPECGEDLDEDGECECGYVANAWTEEARTAAAEARRASAKAGASSRELTTGPHARYGRAAAAASKDAGFHVGGGDHAQAAQFHGEAAAHHDTAGERLQAMGHTDAAEQHFAAAGEHLRAATAHTATSKALTKNANPDGVNQYTVSGGAGGQGHPDSDKANRATDRANRFSSTATQTGTREEHLKAARAHETASGLHSDAGVSHGDMAVKAGMRSDAESKAFSAIRHGYDDQHRTASAAHSEAARAHRMAARASGSPGKPNTNADVTQPRHQESGEFLHTGGKPGTKQTQKAAAKGFGDRDVPYDTDDNYEEALVEPDENDGRELPQTEYRGKATLVKVPDQPSAGKVLNGCQCGGTCPTCQAHLAYNRRWPQPQRDRLAPKDFAGPGQSFPIATQADVDAAAKLVGRAANPEAVKKRITAIAGRKNLTLPDSWKEVEMAACNSNPEGINQYSHAAKQATDAAHEAVTAPGATSKVGLLQRHQLTKAAAKAHDVAAKKVKDKSQRAFHETEATELHAAAGRLLDKHYAANSNLDTGNQQGLEVQPMTRQQKVALLTANCRCEEDKQTINTLSDETLSVLVANAKAEGSNADASAAEGEEQAGGQEDDDEQNDEEWADTAKKQVTKKQPADNAGSQPGHLDEADPDQVNAAMADLRKGGQLKANRRQLNELSVALFGRPVEDVRAVVANALEHERREKLTLARRLVANVADPARRKLLGNKLMKLSKEDLEERVSMLGPVSNEQHRGTPPGAFYGAAGMDPGGLYLGAAGAFEPPTANQTSDDGPPLDIPTINYSELASPNIQANK